MALHRLQDVTNRPFNSVVNGLVKISDVEIEHRKALIQMLEQSIKESHEPVDPSECGEGVTKYY